MPERALPLYLVPLTARELGVVIDALVDLAHEQHQSGDPCAVVPVADAVCARLNELQELDLVPSRQALAAMGVGRHRGRWQG